MIKIHSISLRLYYLHFYNCKKRVHKVWCVQLHCFSYLGMSHRSWCMWPLSHISGIVQHHNVTYSDVFCKQREFAFRKHPLNSILQISQIVFESPVFCGFLAIFRTIEAGAIKKKLCHESRCLKQVIFLV